MVTVSGDIGLKKGHYTDVLLQLSLRLHLLH